MRSQTQRDVERGRQDALLGELFAVYRDVDAAYAGYGCAGTSECCHFAVTGAEPYVTSIELLSIERAVAARGGPLGPRKRALPLLAGDGRDERVCPLLDRGGRCSIYAARPLGCRSFWCHRASIAGPEVTREQLAALVRRIQQIAVRHEARGDQGRPLSRALGAVAGRGGME